MLKQYNLKKNTKKTHKSQKNTKKMEQKLPDTCCYWPWLPVVSQCVTMYCVSDLNAVYTVQCWPCPMTPTPWHHDSDYDQVISLQIRHRCRSSHNTQSQYAAKASNVKKLTQLVCFSFASWLLTTPFCSKFGVRSSKFEVAANHTQMSQSCQSPVSIHLPNLYCTVQVSSLNESSAEGD